MVNNLSYLFLPLDSDCLVIECDGCEQGWRAILKKKNMKKIHDEEIYYEVNVVIKALEGFKLFLVNKSEITIRTDCEAIVANK